MALFDSIVGMASEKLGLGDKAGSLLTGLMGLMTDKNSGGFAGFLNKFREAGLGSSVDSWVSSGDNAPLSGEQVMSALGNDSIAGLANKIGIGSGTAASALGMMIPGIVDKLTPDGVVPAEGDLMSKLGGYISGLGGAAAGAVSMAAGVAGSGKAALDQMGEMAGGDGGGSLLKWLIPLILLGVLIALGYWMCGPGPATPANVSTNANKANVSVTANANANANVGPAATKTLSEIALPNGTKLQAFPGGIEDQLIKFIQSDEYKNGTDETLKNKWFNFDDLNFKSGSSELTPESKRQVDNIAAILKAFPDVKIKIGGYTDKVGNDAGNLKLSDSRAKAVKAVLEKAGVGAQVPEAEGYGEKFATVAETASDEERKADRKTAVRLVKG